MGSFIRRIGVLTSSRADYGIYLPLINKIRENDFFILEVIAFGNHFSKVHGLTINEIENDHFNTIHKINSLVNRVI